MYPDYNNGQQNFNYQSSLNQPVNYNNGFVPYQDPVKLEKKNIRSYGNRLGGAMLLTLVGVNIIGVIFIMAATIIGKQALVDSPIFDLVFQFIFSILMFVPAFAIVAKLSKFRIGDLFVHKSIPASHTFWFVCMGLMVAMGANVVVNWWYNILDGLGCNLDFGELELPDSVGGIIFWVFTISVLPAIVEEFGMRVVTLGMLRRFGDPFAIVASALIFGIIHGNAIQIPFAFALGLILAYITVVTGSVIPAIIIHFINNFYSCITQIATELWSKEIQFIVNYVPFILFVILGLIGCVFLSRKTVYFKKRLYRPQSLLTQRRSFVTFFFTSPCIIIFWAYHILQAGLLLLPQMAEFL